MAQPWQKIGKIGKPHGLDGAFYVGGRLDRLPADYRELVVGSQPETGFATAISGYRVHKERVVLSLAAFSNRTSLEPHVGASLWARPASDALDYDALVGRPVVDAEGVSLGTVHEFFNYGASDTFEIRASDGRSLELPFVASFLSNFHELRAAAGSLRLMGRAEDFAELWVRDLADASDTPEEPPA